MKLLLVTLLLFSATGGFSQLPWKCIYADSAIFIMSDSFIKSMVDDMREKNRPEIMIDAMVEKLKSSPAYKARTKYVIATADSTLVEADVADYGTLNVKDFDDEEFVMRTNGIWYRSQSGKFDSALKTSPRIFHATGRKPIFFNYECKEYVSSDSTCTVWATEQLPASINPGLITEGITGAVLFYEWKTDKGIVQRCSITKIVQKGK